MKRLLKVLKVGGIIVVLLLLLVGITIDILASNVANRLLPTALHTKASVGRVHIGLLRGVVGFSRLQIAQPDAFTNSGPDLLRIGSFGVNVKLAGLSGSGPVVIQNVEVKDLFVHVIRNPTGDLNFAALGTPSPTPLATNAAVEAVTNASVAKPATEKGRAMIVRHVRIRNGVIRYTDRQLGGEKPVDLELKDIELDLDDLVVDGKNLPATLAPAVLKLTAKLPRQDAPDARIGATARIGPVGPEVPAVQASLRLIGFEFDPFEPLLPAGTRTALGGNGVDVAADISVATNLLRIKGAVTMDGGSHYPININGTPAAPVFDTSSVLYGTFGRLSGGVQGTTKLVTDTGLAAAGTVVDTAGSVAGGALKTVTSFGRAIGATAAAGLKGDLKGVESGLVDTVSAPVSGVYGTVTGTAHSVASGLAKSADAATGGQAFSEWRKATDTRWEKAWTAAREQVDKASWPPVPTP